VHTDFEQMKDPLKNRIQPILMRYLLTGLMLGLLAASAAAGTGNYEVNLSWFVDMQQYGASAHADLFCSRCHQSVAEQAVHPDPAHVTLEAAGFFKKGTCAGPDCHENTLADYDKGVHGRIRFENREKYGNCIECHDPHRVKPSGEKEAQTPGNKGRTLCQPQTVSQTERPPECKQDDACLECHLEPTGDTTKSAQKEATLCFHCHDRHGSIPKNPDFGHIPTIDVAAYATTAHADIRCSDCHTHSATYGHENVVQDCRQCHSPHDEKPIHDAHSRVECRACHLQGAVEVDPARRLIAWRAEAPRQNPVRVHQLVATEDETNCVRCHTDNNRVGAAAMVLPAKSIICMSCHTATFSVSDPVTLVTLLGGILIFLGLVAVWLTAGQAPDGQKSAASRIAGAVRSLLAVVFSRRIIPVLKALLLDAIIQRRLFIQSKWRWFSHGLIFYPFLLRFGWGMMTLLLSLVFPRWEGTTALVDKNHPLVAFLFDLTGVLIIAGVILVITRKTVSRGPKWPGLPRQEWLSPVLLGGIIIVGFILEGLRIAMTIDVGSQQFAFLGYAISLVFNTMNGATELYGYLWYLHAILTGAFIIWLPFSRMFHIVMGPVAIAVNAVLEMDRHGKS